MSANMREEQSKYAELPSRDESQIHRQKKGRRGLKVQKETARAALWAALVDSIELDLARDKITHQLDRG